MTAANLGVTPNSGPQGYSSNSVNPDSQYEAYPSTSVDKPNYATSTVLLPGISGACDGSAEVRCVLGPAQMTGRSIGSAQATQDQTGQWVVDYSLAGAAGSALWDKVADANFHQFLGIELDGKVYSAPIIQPTQTTFSSFDGKGEISGSLTQSEAQNLAQAMNFGALPVVLKAATSETVSATLGHSALVAGLGAGIVGLALVLLYVLFYYRGLGLVVISGLLLTALMLWAIISALGHTSVAPSFDLAGITGLIVSIGITVDSYIVYFERLKDETRSGRSVRTSVDRGFKSAWRTVWAADFVSLLAAIVLYLVAVGNVKGFAFFLGLSTIMDMAVTWFYTRPLVILMGQSSRLQGSGAFSIATGLGAGPQSQGPGIGIGAAAGCRGGRRRLVSDNGRGRGNGNGDGDGDGSSLDDVPEDEVEQLEESVDTEDLDEEDLVSLDDAARALLAREPKGHGPFARLYRGETRFDFVGKRKIWFSISTAIIVLGIISIVLRGGLNLGIEFKGGTEWTIAAPGVTQTEATNALKGTGLIDPTVELLGSGSKQTLNVQSDLNKLSQDQQTTVGKQVQKALLALTASNNAHNSCGDHHVDNCQADDDNDSQGRSGCRGIHHHVGADDHDHVDVGDELGHATGRQDQHHHRRPHVGLLHHEQGDRGVDHLLHRGGDLHQHPFRAEDGAGRLHRHDPRRPGGHRHLLDLQLPGDAGHRGGHPDHPGLLPLRHRRGVRPRS